MAAAAAAALLDELMGRDRNLAPTEKKREIRWDDPQVCKHFLVKFCPNELFVNTRADLGPCEKIHDEQLKSEYEKSSSYQKMGYEEDFLRFCQGMMADVERRIRRGKQRLAQGNQEANAAKIPTPAPSGNNSEKITMLSERINGLLEQVEKLGCEGKVEEAQGIMKLCDQLKDEREGLRRSSENSHWLQTAEIAAAQEKQMEVCEVCGAFLIVGDAQQRVDDHLMGKQHMGFAKIKATVDEILAKRQKEREEREQRREKEREEKRKVREEEEKLREKDREERRKKYEEDRKRDRERSKKRKKSRSRSRDRKRSHSRNRKRSRSRSRDRRRSKERIKRSRSRDKYTRNDHKKVRRSRSRSRSHGEGKSRHKHCKKEAQMIAMEENIYPSKPSIGSTMVEITQNLSLPDSFTPFKEEKWENINPQTAVIEAVYPIVESKPIEEESSASSGGGTGANNSGAKWQVSGWTEVKTRFSANGAKSEGDSDK